MSDKKPKPTWQDGFKNFSWKNKEDWEKVLFAIAFVASIAIFTAIPFFLLYVVVNAILHR